MEQVTVFTMTTNTSSNLFWTRKLSLTARILAVNIFAVAALAGGILYLDNYRSNLVLSRQKDDAEQIALLANAAAQIEDNKRNDFLLAFAKEKEMRIRIYQLNGEKIMDSFVLDTPQYRLRDPAAERWQKDVARFLDRVIDTIVGAPELMPFAEPATDNLANWPELKASLSSGQLESRIRFAPDRTLVISAASRIAGTDLTLLSTRNARPITATVREQRLALGIIFISVLIVSILLSLFLARTIVSPLQRLALAANQVRLGRSRDVEVPRLPSRGDEIGQLARALSDMTNTLRQRIDATEAFAADVSHEIKNPLASLRSALEGVERIEDPDLRKQLLDIACSDVLRIDRLISDISEASRVDAQLTRTRFLPIDIGEMVAGLLSNREERQMNQGRAIAYARPRKNVAMVFGENNRLMQVIQNLLDNAVSFSPKDGLIEILVTRDAQQVVIQVIDEGPGIAEREREDIFRRFYSGRQEEAEFGKHSGLGLAISRSIIEAHEGSIVAGNRGDNISGACFTIRLPAIPTNIIVVE
jgi:two-component system sensor histidine kinase ChvG